MIIGRVFVGSNVIHEKKAHSLTGNRQAKLATDGTDITAAKIRRTKCRQAEHTELHKNTSNTIRKKEQQIMEKQDVDQREQLEQQPNYTEQEAEQMGLA